MPSTSSWVELRVDPGEAAGHALGEHLLARQHAVALEQQLGARTPSRSRPRFDPLTEQRRGQRPPALNLSRCRSCHAVHTGSYGQWPAGHCSGCTRHRKPRSPQRRERVVGDLARPDQIPQRVLQLGRGDLGADVDQQVAEERGARAQPLAQRLVQLARRRLAAPAARRAAAPPRGSRAPRAPSARARRRRARRARRTRTAGPSRPASTRRCAAAAPRAPRPRPAARAPAVARARRAGDRPRRRRADGDRRPASSA